MMSTKIYHGHEFLNGDLTAAIEHLHGLRAEAAQTGERLVAQRLASLAVRRLDAAVRKGRPLTSPLTDALATMFDERTKAEREMRRDPMWDTKASIVLIPIEGRVLALPYADMPEIHEIITRGLSPLPWWDNTDRPEGVPEEEWEETGRLWKTALNRDPLGRPGGCGVTVEFLEAGGAPGLDQALAAVPSDEERAAALFCAEFVERNRDGGDFDEILRLTAQARTAPERAGRIEEIRQGLTPITREVLLNGTGR